MGRASRQKPALLAEKLKGIRDKLELSQNGMIRRMGLEDELTQAEISAFERGVRIPPLNVLLHYAEAAGICTDVLIRDSTKLPKKLPSEPKHRT